MIEVYKMGSSYYSGGIDKNSGLTEAFMINRALNSLDDHGKDILVIINGVRDNDDIEYLSERMKQADLNIFIMSDSIALKSNLDIINKCDLCLHQGINYHFEEIKCNQFYSYVPELFYNNAKAEYKYMKTEKKDLVLFGGNNLDRNDKFIDYEILNSDIYKTFVKLYDKDGNTISDERIAYEDYLKELAACKYSLVICREDYRRSNWITARFFESIAMDCLPIVDEDYCNKFDGFIFPIKVKDYDTLIKFKNLCDLNDNREKLLMEYHNKMLSRKDMFVVKMQQYIEYSDLMRKGNENV